MDSSLTTEEQDNEAPLASDPVPQVPSSDEIEIEIDLEEEDIDQGDFYPEAYFQGEAEGKITFTKQKLPFSIEVVDDDLAAEDEDQFVTRSCNKQFRLEEFLAQFNDGLPYSISIKIKVVPLDETFYEVTPEHEEDIIDEEEIHKSLWSDNK